jgi:hypothetical protein
MSLYSDSLQTSSLSPLNAFTSSTTSFPSSSLCSSSQQSLTLPPRPTTTGSIAMDQFYTKQYCEQLTKSLLTDTIGISIQPNQPKSPTHRSHSAQRYRKLRSPFLTQPKTKTKSSRQSSSSSTPSLPTPIKPSQHNPQIEKIFLNSGRHGCSPPPHTSCSSSTPPVAAAAASPEKSFHLSENYQRRRQGGASSRSMNRKHYMERTGHLRSETYEGVQKSLHLVTYFTENNYR